MQPNYRRGVAFLLSLGTLPIACGKDGKDSDSGTDATGAYAAHYVECLPMYTKYQDILVGECIGYKDHATMLDGPACKEAYEAHLVCLTNTDCADLDNEPPDLPCVAESQALMDACPSSGP